MQSIQIFGQQQTAIGQTNLLLGDANNKKHTELTEFAAAF
jgi:hypothetical protein